MRIYGDSNSGNCMKVRWLLDAIGRPYAWTEVDLLAGDTRTADYLALNPAGQVPLAVFDDGRTLAQSNALLLYFGEGTRFLPVEPYRRAQVHAWLFWEQNSHEIYVAGRRYQLRYLQRDPAELDPSMLTRGTAALAHLDSAVSTSDFLLGEAPTLADLALVAYTRVAPQGGFDLSPFSALAPWIARTEAKFGIEPLTN